MKKGDFVVEYFGPLITHEEADRTGGKYLFAVIDTPWVIEGKGRENLARYLNHSCKPNCEAIADGNRILIHAKRTIQPGEELTYDYGPDYMADAVKKGECKCGYH